MPVDTSQIDNLNQRLAQKEKLIDKMTQNLADSEQTIREIAGELNLTKQSREVISEGAKKHFDRIWGEYATLLSSPLYQCEPPSNDHEIWKKLIAASKSKSMRHMCGCLWKAQQPMKKCYDQVDEDSDCTALWFMFVGDSTTASLAEHVTKLLEIGGWTGVPWSPSTGDEPNSLRPLQDKVRVALNRPRGTLSQRYDSDYALEKPGYPTIVISLRRVHGMGLSKWKSVLENPNYQHQIPDVTPVHPVLDEPHFVPIKSQLKSIIPKTCDSETMKPNWIVGGSALWDTFADSNMQHRTEISRCGFQVSSKDISKYLYDVRLPALFNTICNYTRKSHFVWRTSNLAPKYTTKSGENLLHLKQYPLTGYFNNQSRKAAEIAGVPVYDFEKLHQEERFPGKDRIHAPSFVYYKAIEQLLSDETISLICKHSSLNCTDGLTQVRQVGALHYPKSKDGFWKNVNKHMKKND